jgi:hypothetical protein
MIKSERKIERDRRALFCEIVYWVLIGIFTIAVYIQTMLHFLKASVVNVNEIWGKGNRFTSEVGE